MSTVLIEIRRAKSSDAAAVAEERRLDPGLLALESARTHFERKYLARGETCFALRLMR